MVLDQAVSAACGVWDYSITFRRLPSKIRFRWPLSSLKNRQARRTIPSSYRLCRVRSPAIVMNQESNVAEASTIIYTHPDCAYSQAAKMDYRKRKVDYTEINLAKQADQIPALLNLTDGERVTPVIVEDGVITIGFKGGT